MRRRFAVVALAVLAACGGGGGGGGADPGPGQTTLAVAFGNVASNAATTAPRLLTNPLEESATLSVETADAPFGVAASFSPTNVPAGSSTSVPLRIDPLGAVGPFSGAVRLRFQGASAAHVFVVDCTATSYAPAVTATTTSLAFGEVLPGTQKDKTLSLSNASPAATAHVTAVSVPSGFSLVTPLPVTIAPGAAGSLTVRYAPTGPGAPGGNVTVTTDDPDGPAISVPTTASSGGEEVTDFGTQSFLGDGRTAPLTFSVPADAISFQVEAAVTTGTIGLGSLTGPNGEVFENEQGTGAYLQWPDRVFSAQVPNTDRAGLQLVPGTWTLKIARVSGSATSATVKVIVERRPGPTAMIGTLDLNVFFANAITPKAATLTTDTNLLDILARVDTILATQGIRLGELTGYDVTDPTYDDVTNAEFPGLLALSSAASARRLNYFLVRTALGGGVIGLAAKIDGPAVNGTEVSGVMGLWIENPTASQRDLVARVMAHEMGHFLGLYHTTESDGTNDFVDDTYNCPATGCTDPTQKYLMHWNASTGGSIVTNGQGLVLRGHPLIAAAVPAATALRARDLHIGEDPLPVSSVWCGTCARAAAR